MGVFASTIPAAITTLEGYMTAVAAATSVSDVNVYVGFSVPPSGQSYNFMMVGDYETNSLITETASQWASWSTAAKRRTEEYAINGAVVCWAGGNDWQSRMNDAYNLLDGLQEQILSDPSGSGNLSGSGSWGAFNHRMIHNGPFENIAGWGVVLGFELSVVNVRLFG